MKKILLFLIFLWLIISCGKKFKVESMPKIEREVKIWKEELEEEEYPTINVIDDDGMIYANRENLEKLLKNLVNFDYIDSDENKIVLENKEYRVEVNFKEKKLRKKFLGYGKKIDKMKNLGEKNGIIYEKYFSYERKLFVREEEEFFLNNLEGKEILIYDLARALEMNFAKDSKKVKTIYIVGNSYSPGIFMSRKTNEYSFEIIREDVEKMIKLSLLKEEELFYLDGNKEKFIDNFYKEIKKFSLKVNRGHFGMTKNLVDNKTYLANVGDLKHFDIGNSTLKILDDKIAYLKVRTFSENSYDRKFDNFFEEYEEIIDEVEKYKNLIIDVRNNSGGSLMYKVYFLSLLTNKDIYHYYKTLEGNKKVKVEDLSPREYKGNLIVLANKSSYSAATIFPSLVKSNKLGIVIGEKTGGQADPTMKKVLPNGIVVRDSTLVVMTNENFESIDNGMIPDILVEDVAIKGDRDPILTKAIEYFGTLD